MLIIIWVPIDYKNLSYTKEKLIICAKPNWQVLFQIGAVRKLTPYEKELSKEGKKFV